MYDISPIVVTVNDRPPSFLHFLVRMCAVIGGVFAITSEAPWDLWVWDCGGEIIHWSCQGPGTLMDDG